MKQSWNRGDLFDKSTSAEVSKVSSDVIQSSLSRTLTIDAGAQVQQVLVTVHARPPSGPIAATAAGEVRDTPGGAILDFGRMRTVTGVSVPGGALTNVFAWQGAAFSATGVRTDTGTNPVNELDFGELLTERLWLVGPNADTVKARGTVTLPTAPADLEVVVAGKRAWFQQGEAKQAAIGVAAGPGDYFIAQVDVTDAVAAAARAASAKQGGSHAAAIAIELRASTSGVLGLDIASQMVRIFPVDFPGPQQAVTIAEEGPATLALPLPPASSAWRVQGIAFTAIAKLGATRVLPAIGPALSSAAELVLDLDHPLALQVAASDTGNFATLSGVRVRVRVDEGSAEIGGVLLADAGGVPGDPLPGGNLAPVTVAQGDAAWQTLALSRAVPAPAGPLWVALQAAHGKAIVVLADTGGDVRRGKPGGPWRAFSRGVAFTPKAAVRLVGAAADTHPIDALEAAIGGKSLGSFTPTADGLAVNLVVDPAITPAAGGVTLALTATAASSYRFQDVQVFYQV